MNSKKAVLVTGGSGFIGSAVVDTLLADGWQVVTTTRSNRKSESTVFLDLSLLESIVAVGSYQHFDAIVHLGACIGWSGQSISELFMPNVVATGLLAEIAAKLDAKFVFASAAIVHGGGTERIAPDTPLLPDTPYGKSKWLAEELVAASGVKNCILRMGGVFGLDGPAHLGINRAITNAIGKIPPQLNGAGEALRSYIYVKDIAMAISFVLSEDIEGTHLLSGSEVTSIKTMLRQICDVFLSGQSPLVVEGPEAKNQIIIPSDVFPCTLSFSDALKDIRKVSSQ